MWHQQLHLHWQILDAGPCLRKSKRGLLIYVLKNDSYIIWLPSAPLSLLWSRFYRDWRSLPSTLRYPEHVHFSHELPCSQLRNSALLAKTLFCPVKQPSFQRGMRPRVMKWWRKKLTPTSRRHEKWFHPWVISLSLLLLFFLTIRVSPLAAVQSHKPWPVNDTQGSSKSCCRSWPCKHSVGSEDTHAMAHGHCHGERAFPPTMHLVTTLLLAELTAH